MACDIQGTISNSHHLYLENGENPVEITSLDLTGKTIINKYVFHGCSYITSVLLDTALTSIGNSAFEKCTNLVIADLNLPNLTSLGTYAFSGTKIQTISDLGSVTSIPESCFYDCSQLTTINLNNITSIGNQAFRNCNNLIYFHGSGSVAGELNLSNVTLIGHNAFNNCKGITSVTLPNSLIIIEQYAFSDCSGLASVTIPSSVTSIGGYAFRGCSGLTSVIIPNNVTKISDGAFSSCHMNSIILNEGLEEVGSYGLSSNDFTTITFPSTLQLLSGPYGCLDKCSQLQSVIFLGTTPPTINQGALLYGVPNTCKIYVPDASMSAYETALSETHIKTYC